VLVRSAVLSRRNRVRDVCEPALETARALVGFDDLPHFGRKSSVPAETIEHEAGIRQARRTPSDYDELLRMSDGVARACDPD